MFLSFSGITTVEVSPALTQTTWAANYVGPLFTARFSPSTTALDFVWTVTDQFGIFPANILTLTAVGACATSVPALSAEFSATCTGTETTISATQPIFIPINIALTATVSATPAISTVLNTQVIPTGNDNDI